MELKRNLTCEIPCTMNSHKPHLLQPRLKFGTLVNTNPVRRKVSGMYINLCLLKRENDFDCCDNMSVRKH